MATSVGNLYPFLGDRQIFDRTIADARIVLETAPNFRFLTLLDCIQSKISKMSGKMHH